MRAPSPSALALCLAAAACGTTGPDAPLYTTEILTRNAGGAYSAELTVHDGTCALAAVDASGPAITGTASLVRADTARGCEWHHPVDYGTVRPDPLPVYTLTITQNGQSHTEPLAVACFEETVATPVTPADPTPNPVELAWGPGGAYGFDYLVSVGGPSDPPSDNPALALPTVLTNQNALLYQLAPAQLPFSSTGFRVFMGPVRWTLHEASSCYSVSAASGPFTVIP